MVLALKEIKIISSDAALVAQLVLNIVLPDLLFPHIVKSRTPKVKDIASCLVCKMNLPLKYFTSSAFCPKKDPRGASGDAVLY